MEEKQEARRSFILDVDDAKKELVQAVNNIIQKYRVPCYFLESTLQELARQVHNVALQEIDAAQHEIMAAQQGEES